MRRQSERGRKAGPKNLVTTDAGRGKILLERRSLSDNKMLTRGSSSSAYVTAPLEQAAAVDRRQQRGANDYAKRAQELDRQIPGHQPDEEGPFTKELKSYGDNELELELIQTHMTQKPMLRV